MSDETPGRRRPVLPPVAYPLIGLVFGAILVFSFSRILLAVRKDWAPAIALLMALCVLAGAGLVAYGSRVRRRPASFPLLVVAAGAVVAVGVAAMNLPQEAARGGESRGPGSAVKVALVARNIAFDKTELQFPAGAKVEIAFSNRDQGVPHDVALFTDEAKTQVYFRGDLVTGPATTTYSFDAPASPGTLYFHCDVHPTQMNGTVVVGPPGPGGGGGNGGGGGGGGPGATVVAQGTAFQTPDVAVQGGGQVTIRFDNRDAGIPHNMAVFQGADASAPVLFRGDLVTGPAAKDYAFSAPPPGTYFFQCDVHPTQMTGTLTVR